MTLREHWICVMLTYCKKITYFANAILLLSTIIQDTAFGHAKSSVWPAQKQPFATSKIALSKRKQCRLLHRHDFVIICLSHVTKPIFTKHEKNHYADTRFLLSAGIRSDYFWRYDAWHIRGSESAIQIRNGGGSCWQQPQDRRSDGLARRRQMVYDIRCI